jgi:hypothetical protein
VIKLDKISRKNKKKIQLQWIKMKKKRVQSLKLEKPKAPGPLEKGLDT